MILFVFIKVVTIDRVRAYKNKIEAWGQFDSRWRKYKATGKTPRYGLHKSKAKKQRRDDQTSFETVSNSGGRSSDRPVSFLRATEQESTFDISTPDLQLNTVDSQQKNPDSQLNALNLQGKTKLHHAVEDDDFVEVSYLLSMGAAVDQVDGDGDTSLVIATKRGYTILMELLLKHGANANFFDEGGRRPVHLCLLRPAELQMLLSADADPNGADKDGNTALHLIFRRSEWLAERAEAVIHMLLSHGANVNTPNNNGDTPLHLMLDDLSFSQWDKCLPEMVVAGANLSMPDSHGRTPFQLFVNRAADSRLWAYSKSTFQLFIENAATCYAFVYGRPLLSFLLEEQDELGELDAIILNLCSFVGSNLDSENIISRVVSSWSRKKQDSMERYLSAVLQTIKDPDQLDKFGSKALLTLIESCTPRQDLERSLPLLKILLEHGVSPMCNHMFSGTPIYYVHSEHSWRSGRSKGCYLQIVDTFLEAMSSPEASDRHLKYVTWEKHEWWERCLKLHWESKHSRIHALLEFLKQPTSAFPANTDNFPMFLAEAVASTALQRSISRYQNRDMTIENRTSLSLDIVTVLQTCSRLDVKIDESYYKFLDEPMTMALPSGFRI